ncbi:hypothetical protein V8F06_012268 [Rhypophila decipiens]
MSDYTLDGFRCGEEDYECMCNNLDAVVSSAVICTWDVCGGFDQAVEVGTVVRELCTCVDTTGNPPPLRPASSSVAVFPASSGAPASNIAAVSSSAVGLSLLSSGLLSSSVACSTAVSSSIVSSADISSSATSSSLVASSTVISSSSVVPSDSPSSTTSPYEDDYCIDEPDISSPAPPASSTSISLPAVVTPSTVATSHQA